MIKVWTGLAALAATAIGALAQSANYEALEIDGRDALADVRVLQTALERVHPGYTRFASKDEMDAAFSALRAEIRRGTTDEALYLMVSRLLEQIRCDHTKAEYPAALREHRERTPTHLPVRMRIFGERLFVHTSIADGIDRGDEILSINGFAAAQLIAETLALVPIDGSTDHARAAEAELSSEFEGSGLDHFMPLLHGWSPAFTFELRGSDGEVRTVEADAVARDGFTRMVESGDSWARDFVDAVEVRYQDDAAILRVDTFVNYRRPVDAMETLGRVFDEIAERDVRHLVVDLRRNGGGSDDAALALLRHLITEPIEIGNGTAVRALSIPQAVREHATTWDWDALERDRGEFERWGETGLYVERDAAPLVIPPAGRAFRGRVTVLSSRGNASGSTMLIAGLQQRGGVRIVGEPTGGSVEGPTAGVILFVELPASGVRVRVPCVRTVTGLEPSEPGGGVVPDVLIEPTPEAEFAGRDEVLEAALGS